MAACDSGICVLSKTNPARTEASTIRPRQNGRHFADDIFKRIFLNGNVWISINIPLKFVPAGHINNIPALVQTEPMTVSLLKHICVTLPQ